MNTAKPVTRISQILHTGGDYSSLDTWEADGQGEQGLQVAVLGRSLRDEFRRFTDTKDYQFLFADAFFVAEGGVALASYLDKEFAVLADPGRAFAMPRSDVAVQQAIDHFLESHFGEQRDEGKRAEARAIIRAVGAALARLVADDPTVLDELEWRDAERMLAEVFAGLGFEVALTRPAKDGGKDLILSCDVNTGTCSYIVEVKHWRSGKKVGRSEVNAFLKVIVREKRDGGLLLSTYGFSKPAFEALVEIDRRVLNFGGQQKVVSLCQLYVRTCTDQALLSPYDVWISLCCEVVSWTPNTIKKVPCQRDVTMPDPPPSD